jgi:hypothetical protein
MAMVERVLKFSGALAILAVGAVHLQQYIGADYRAIPTVGTLFLLNAIAAAIVGLGLIAPIERVSPARAADTAIATLALAAVVIAVASLVTLFISESGSLFGFSESGYRTPIVVAIVAEAVTIALLGPLAAVSLVRVASHRRGTTGSRRSPPGESRSHGHPRLDPRSAR